MSGTMTRRTAWRIARHDMGRHRLRTLITALIVAVPVFLFSLPMLAISNFDNGLASSIGTARVVYTAPGQAPELPANAVGDAFTAQRWSVKLPNGWQREVWVSEAFSELDAAWADVRLSDGRWPNAEYEVVAVNGSELLRVGDTVALAAGTEPDTPATQVVYARVVGLVEMTPFRSQVTPEYFAAQPLADVFSLRGGDDLQLVNVILTRTQSVVGVEFESLIFNELFVDGTLAWDNALGALSLLVPFLLIAVLMLALLVTPSFTITAASNAHLLRRLGENGATRKASAQILGAQALAVGMMGSIVGVAVAVGVQLVSQPSRSTFMVPLDLVALTAATAVVAVWGAAQRIARSGRAGLGRRRQWTRRRLVAWTIAGAIWTSLAAAVWVTLAIPDRAAPQLGFVAALMTILAMVSLGPLALLSVARLATSRGFVARYAAREITRTLSRAVPVFSAVGAVVALLVATLLTSSHSLGLPQGSEFVMEPVAGERLSTGELQDVAQRINELDALEAEVVTYAVPPPLAHVLTTEAPGGTITGVRIKSVPAGEVRTLAAVGPSFDERAYDAGEIAVTFLRDTSNTQRATIGVAERAGTQPPEFSSAATFDIAHAQLLRPAYPAQFDVLVSPAGAATLPTELTAAAPVKSKVVVRNDERTVDMSELEHLTGVVPELAVPSGVASTPETEWFTAATITTVMLFFVALVITLLSREMSRNFGALRAIGAPAGATRRAGVIASLLLTVPGCIAGTLVGLALFAYSASYNNISIAFAAEHAAWLPAAAGVAIIPLGAALVAAIATRTPVTTRRSGL